MRNQVFKKLFSVLLALIMVAGLLPASVLAEGEGNADSTPAPTEAVQPTESAEPTAPTETETPEVTEVPAPTPENPAATVEPTQGEPTAEPTDEGIMPANVMPVQANVAARDTSGDDYYRIVHLDCGRKYFDVNYIKGIIDTMYLNGYNQLQLAFGNGGLRFVLNDMDKEIPGITNAIAEGNENFYPNSGQKSVLTESEMTEIIQYANGKKIEIVPLLNMPGHMDGILSTSTYSKYRLKGTVNGEERYDGSLDLNNTDAVDFGKKLLAMYVEYFADKGCKFFNFGADEYGQNIQNPYIGTSVANVTYNQLINYMNACVAIIENAGMTARCFNDFVCYNHATTCALKQSVQVCYWSNQWNGSEYNTVDVINNAGYKLINTNQKWYFVPSKADEYGKDVVLSNFKTFDVTKFQNIKSGWNSTSTTYSQITGGNNVGAMFCVWCDTPSVAVDLSDVKELIAAMADANPTYFTKVTIPTTTVGNATTADNDTVRVTGPNLAALKCETTTVTIQGAAEGKIAAYNVTPLTADNNKYTGGAEVRIKIPEGWDSSKVIAFIVEDGTANDIVDGTATDDGWYVFTAPHFSVMGIYEKAATTEVGGTIEIAKGSTGVITVPGDVINSVGEIADPTVAAKEEVKTVQQTGETINYNATASASITAHTTGNIWNSTTYSASYLIDGEESTYYWSSKARTVGAYAQVDLGAAIPFDAVRIIPTRSDDAKCTAVVAVSADGSSWTTIGSYDGTKTTILNNTAGNVRYIKVEITKASGYWWQLAEIQWGSYKDDTFTRMAASGSVTTEGKTETQVTIKGIKVDTTTIEIDGKTYTIKVVDATLAQQVLPINLWITNTGVVPTNWSNGTPAEFTYSDDGGNRRSIYTLKASHSTVNSPNGISLSSILPQVTGTAKSWDNNTYNVTYWKSAYHTAENRQSTDGWTNYSHKGTKFEYIRFYEGSWAYSVDGITWVNIENVGAEAGDTNKNQVCIWYRQVTTVTSEVTTEIVDWGPIQYSADQCLLDFAVKYDGTENRIPNSFPVKGKTVGFACPTDQSVPLGNGYVVKDTDSTYYRTVYGIAGVETAEYEVYMITLTPSSDSHNVYINKGSTQTSYTYGGTEKIAWAKTEADTEHSVLGKISGVQYGGEPFLESVKIYQYQGLLVTYYLRAKQTFDSLTVHYAIQGSGTAFYEYNIAVSNNTFFSENIGLGDPKVGPLKNGTVVNSDGRTIEVSSDLSKLQDVDLQYRYSIYEVVGFWRESEKSIWIYYTFTRDHTYVIDFGLPLEIKLKDFGVTTENMGDIDSISLASMKDKEAKPVHMQEWSHGKAEVLKDTVGNWYVKYILAKPLSNNITIPLYVKFKNRSDAAETLYNANIIPATSVYYEDSFAKFYGSNGKEQTGFSKTNEVTAQTPGVWYIDGQEQTANQALEALGNKTYVYGYDPKYDNCTMFSMGSARKVTVTNDMAKDGVVWPTAQFTFKGTGFDIISLTDNTSGAIYVSVYPGDKAEGTPKKYVVNNYYGYDYVDGKWVVKTEAGNNALYQIPVIKIKDLDYGTYTVVIKVAYSAFQDVADKKQYSFWLDAVRVYDPMGANNSDTYAPDGEAKPVFVEVRDMLLSASSVAENNTNNGVVFIDGNGSAAIATDYKNFGPNHEVYLANNQAIAFTIADAAKYADIQIGIKSTGNSAVKYKINNGTEATIGTATDMYYSIKDYASNGGVVTITNTGEAVLSITNIKCTMGTSSAKTDTVDLVMSAEDVAVAISMVNSAITPVEPEPEPEPEKTFEPDRFEASWSRNVMQGRKATLTVKTSEDVEAITVDGQTIRSYRTRTERVGFGRRAKRITYREFTYSMVAQESADFSVTAINTEGTESEAITARLTVKTRPNSMRDMWDWFKGWF